MNPYEDDAPTHVQGTTPTQPDDSAKSDQKTAITAAVVGTAALGGAAVAMSKFMEDGEPVSEIPDGELPKPDDEGENNLGQDNTNTNPNGNGTLDLNNGGTPPEKIEETPHVKTFEEAFAEARTAHNGGGGYFEFDRDGDGKMEYYSTYLDSEWQSLSHREKQDFYATVPDYQAPTGNGSGGATGALPPDSGIAHQNDVPPPVEGVIGDDDADVTIDDESDDITVSPASTQVSDQSADVARSDLDGQEILVIDIDNDDHPDAIANPDTHVALIDTDHDHILDTRAVYDEDGNVTHTEHIEETISISGSMQVLHQNEQPATDLHEDTSYLAGDSDMGPDFDNHADTSDLDYHV